MAQFEITHGIGEDEAYTVVWQYKGNLELDGKSYPFWYEYDERDGDQTLEFESVQPSSDFDFTGLEAYCYAQVAKKWEV